MDKEESKETDLSLRFMVASRWFDLVRQIIGSLTWIVLAYIGFLSIKALAGKTTITNIILGYFTSAESNYGIPWYLTITFFGWAVYERKLRKRKTKSMQSYIKELELRLDPNRSSSGLLTTGETNPEDKI